MRITLLPYYHYLIAMYDRYMHAYYLISYYHYAIAMYDKYMHVYYLITLLQLRYCYVC